MNIYKRKEIIIKNIIEKKFKDDIKPEEEIK